MHTEKIPVRITQTGQTMEVAVYDKRAARITVVLGEGVHSVKFGLSNPSLLGFAAQAGTLGIQICRLFGSFPMALGRFSKQTQDSCNRK
jgi:hypothetical protein